MQKENWFILTVFLTERHVGASVLSVEKLFKQNKEQSVSIIFLICQKQNARLPMSQCFIYWQKKKYKKLFIRALHFLLSLNIHRFAVKKNVFLCAILTDVVKKRERDLISNNGMTHVNRKSHMTTLEGEVT